MMTRVIAISTRKIFYFIENKESLHVTDFSGLRSVLFNNSQLATSSYFIETEKILMKEKLTMTNLCRMIVVILSKMADKHPSVQRPDTSTE